MMVKKRQSFSVRNPAHQPTLKVMVQLEGSGRNHCTAAEAIGAVRDAGQLPRFEKTFGRVSLDGLGDCHEIAMALMVDLVMARAAEGWSYVLGTIRGPAGHIEHSWLEYDGWAVDAANAKCLVVRASAYPAVAVARRMTPDQFRAWMDAGAPGASLA
jgi:hypothetical protein